MSRLASLAKTCARFGDPGPRLGAAPGLACPASALRRPVRGLAPARAYPRGSAEVRLLVRVGNLFLRELLLLGLQTGRCPKRRCVAAMAVSAEHCDLMSSVGEFVEEQWQDTGRAKGKLWALGAPQGGEAACLELGPVSLFFLFFPSHLRALVRSRVGCTRQDDR